MLLAHAERKIKKIRRDWQNHRRKIAKKIPISHRSILVDLDNIILNSTSKLLEDFNSPTLTIVTTGTTSSGKSTLVNLLCGAEIVPVAVQEMSAGLLTIEHSRSKTLHIDYTSGALWDCGDWYNPSDQEIYDRLTLVMNSYLQAKDNGLIGIAYPRIKIKYPIYLLTGKNRLKLPKGVNLKIIDLPGISHHKDVENLSLLNMCDQALFLITYNSAETDRQKTMVLLECVVNQLKVIGGLSKNLWFLFNRIDVFYGDCDRLASETQFINRTRSEINTLLTKYQLNIESGQVLKISTMPALLSLLMRGESDNKRIEAGRRLKRNYNFLIPDNISDTLPQNPTKWTSSEFQIVASSIWDSSHAEEFERLLNQNIQMNLVDLIFFPIVKKFERELCFSITKWADITIDQSMIRHQVKLESINFVKNHSNQLLHQLNWSTKIFVQFVRILHFLRKYTANF